MARANPSIRQSVKSPTDRAALYKGDGVSYQCPECKGNMRAYIAPELFLPGEPLICPKCAAVVMVDQASKIRPCLTQELLDVVWSPRRNDFWERRAEILERLTAPPSSSPSS